MEEKLQGRSSIIGSYKIDKNRIEEMDKPKTLYVQSMDMNQGGGMLVGGRYRAEGNKGEN